MGGWHVVRRFVGQALADFDFGPVDRAASLAACGSSIGPMWLPAAGRTEESFAER